MLCSVITKNSNWKILTKNLCAMGWRMKNFNIFWVHAKIRVLELQGVLKNQYIGVDCLKRGRWTNCRLKEVLIKKKEGVLRGEGWYHNKHYATTRSSFQQIFSLIFLLCSEQKTFLTKDQAVKKPITRWITTASLFKWNN